MTEAEENTARHECGHAAAALVQGLPVTAVSRTSPDPSRYLGYTSIPIDALTDGELARKGAIMLLAGPGMADQPLPTWPLNDDDTNDEKLLKIFCEYLKLDARGYDQLISEMWQLTLTKRFDRLFRVLTTWFEYRRILDEYVLTWSMAKVMTWPEPVTEVEFE